MYMKTPKNMRLLLNGEKIKIRYVVLIIISMAFLACMALYTYFSYVNNIPNELTPKSLVVNHPDESKDLKCMNQNDCIEQEIEYDSNGFQGLILYANISSQDKKNYSIQLLDFNTRKVLYRWDNLTSQNSMIEIMLDKPLPISEGEKKCILKIQAYSTMNNSTIRFSDSDAYQSGKCFYNGTEIEKDVNFEIIPHNISTLGIKKLFVLLIIIMLVTLGAICIMTIKKIKVEKIFLCFMLGFGVVYLFVLIPYSAPDEPVHFATAYHISNVIMSTDTNDEERWVSCRNADNDSVFGCDPGIAAYAKIVGQIDKTVKNSKVNTKYTAGQYMTGVPFYVHLPQAVGITLGRILKLSYSDLIILSELFALIVYIVLAYVSIKIIPIGKYVLFAISALPMTLQLATSCSYDIITMGITYLYIAYFMKLLYSSEQIGLKECCVIMGLSVIQAPCKLIYCILSFLVILIPNHRFSTKRLAYIVKVIGPLVSLVVGYLPNISRVPTTTNGKYIVEWAGEEGYTISYILHHIKETIILFFGTIHDKLDLYITSTIGKDLGWFDLHVPEYLIIVMAVLLIFSIHADSKIEISVHQKICYIIMFVGVVALSCATMLLAWTPLSYRAIEGVQGRYFLPALPLLLISFMNPKTNYSGYGNIVTVGAGVVNYMVILSLFESIVSR